MKHWPTKKLGEVAILNPKKSELKDLPDDLLVSFIPMSALDEITQTIKTNELRKLSNVRKGYTYFKEGDILFSKITPCMENGKVAVAKNLKNGIGFGSTEFHVLRPSDKVLSEWIFYIVGSIAFREEAKKHMTGTAGQQRVPIGFLENVKIPLPPLSEQKRIVEKIEKLFAKIHEAERLRAESLAASAALLPSALHKVFSSAKKENWPNKKLGEVCDFQGGTQPPKSVFKYEPQKGYVRLLQIRDFVSDAKATYIPDSPKLRKCAIDDILIGRYGASVGKILKGKSGAYNVAIIKAIPNENFLLKDYLYLFLQSPDIQKGFTNFSKRAAQAGFTKEELGSFEISLPPLSEQKKIVAYLDAVSQKFQELQKLQQQTAADFSALRQSILAEVFNQK